MVRKLPRDLQPEFLRVKTLQGPPDVFVEHRTLHLVEFVVEVLLEQTVNKTVMRDHLPTQPADTKGLYQPVLTLQLTAQLADEETRVAIFHCGDNFRIEFQTLNAGDREIVAQISVQAAQAFLDDTLHTGG